ncbi:MAG: histidine phosphatase family protein [Actinomycetes bacterium]
MSQHVWLVRHGETDWSLTGQHTGGTDLPLTAKGEERARSLRRVLSAHPFDLVLSSPLQRARRTAELAGFSPDACDDLREWDYGDYEGRTTADIHTERPGWSLWRDGAPNGETAADVAARADRVVARARAVDGDVVLFAHGHLLRVLGARWVGLLPEDGRLLALDTGAICVLGYERETAVLQKWNYGPSL